MDFRAFLDELRTSPGHAGRVVHVHETPERPPRFGEPERPLAEPIRAALRERGIQRLYTHQAAALDLVRAGHDVVVATGTASGKSLCYVLPLLEMLQADPAAKALLLFPTKALCQDQFRGFRAALEGVGLSDRLAGVYDGDTPAALRRRLRDGGSVLFSNPDMLHSALLPQHGRWAGFLRCLRLLVLDELHTYSGIFGSNVANLLRRFRRVCAHHGADPRIVACSATLANPGALFERLTGRPARLVGPEHDGSPRGRRFTCLWNPPRVRRRTYRSRRSANVEAHELMARLLQRGVPTITFSKAKMTAEMIHRYVREALRRKAPHLADKVTPYRGGYPPHERREIERRLFEGDLLGVSATRALELGIDVGGLDACILVGYPGTLASFFQQGGRAGRQLRDSLVVLIGLDTAVNQYVLSHPEYLFDRPVEEAVVDPDNPFVVLTHLRCAAQELPLEAEEADAFGPHASAALRVLEENGKLRRIEGRWYHAASETPQHETPLRGSGEGDVIIQDVDTGAALGQMNEFDAPPILHPEAIYLHRGETYRVLSLELERRLCRVQRVEVDYYTQPVGGADVHHVDRRLCEKPFGTGRAFWGEVTAYHRTVAYEKVHFYSLDTVSVHPVRLPTLVEETAAFWLVPPTELMERVRRAGLDAHSGLRGIGYATRMHLPLFMTCDTRDFSHSIGSVNSEWNALFVWEHYLHGLGFTRKAFDRLHEILPAVFETIRRCDCAEGCPCCVGKPLRTYSTWNVERGEASIPSKRSALMILEGLLGDGRSLQAPEGSALSDDRAAAELRLERALKRRLEAMREPKVFHPIRPVVETGYPAVAPAAELAVPDVARRADRARAFEKGLRKRLAKKIAEEGLSPHQGRPAPPPGMKTPSSNLPPGAFPGRPVAPPKPVEGASPAGTAKPDTAPRRGGDALAARARRRAREHRSKGRA